MMLVDWEGLLGPAPPRRLLSHQWGAEVPKLLVWRWAEPPLLMCSSPPRIPVWTLTSSDQTSQPRASHRPAWYSLRTLAALRVPELSCALPPAHLGLLLPAAPHPHLSLQLVPSTHQAPTQPQPSPLGPPSKASAMEAQVSGPQDWPPWQSRHSPLEKSPQTEGLSWQNLMGSSARARVMLYHHSPTQHHTTGSGSGLGGEK